MSVCVCWIGNELPRPLAPPMPHSVKAALLSHVIPTVATMLVGQLFAVLSVEWFRTFYNNSGNDCLKVQIISCMETSLCFNLMTGWNSNHSYHHQCQHHPHTCRGYSIHFKAASNTAYYESINIVLTCVKYSNIRYKWCVCVCVMKINLKIYLIFPVLRKNKISHLKWFVILKHKPYFSYGK